jgi:hypothetical protein
VVLSGWFTIIWGDGAPGSSVAPAPVYMLTNESGQITRLQLSEVVIQFAGGVLALNRKHVRVEGEWARSAPQATGAANPLRGFAAFLPSREASNRRQQG